MEYHRKRAREYWRRNHPSLPKESRMPIVKISVSLPAETMQLLDSARHEVRASRNVFISRQRLLDAIVRASDPLAIAKDIADAANIAVDISAS